MRVGFLIDEWRPDRGGAERALAAFAAHLVERGHEVHAFAREADPAAPGEAHLVRASGATRAKRERRLARALVDAAGEAGCDATVGVRHLERVDLYWPHDGAHRETLQAQRRARGRSPEPRWPGRHRAFLELEAQLLAEGGARVVACVSELVRRELAEHYPACADRLRAAPNGVDLRRFHPDRRMDRGWHLRGALEVDARTPLFAFAGADGVRKGLPTLLEALAGMTGERWKLVVAGVRHPARWRRIARARGLDDGRVLVVEPQDAAALFAAADVTVLPTWRDACGLVVLESLAAGTPVVTTAAAGAAEAVRTPAAGTVLPEPGDPAALRAALDEQRDRVARDTVDRTAVRACVTDRAHGTWMATLEACLLEATGAPEPGTGGYGPRGF